MASPTAASPTLAPITVFLSRADIPEQPFKSSITAMVAALTVILVIALFSLEHLFIKYRDIGYVCHRTELMKFHRDNYNNKNGS